MARRRKGRPVHGILLLDKPSGGSSNHALQRAKRLYDASKAGHTGSLDPLATGMLPVCFGEATKLSHFLLDADKSYETTLQLGVTTHSADADGEVLETRPLPEALSDEVFANVCNQFVGSQWQIPPMVSAIKVNGQRLYKLAREGKSIERTPRHVVIHELTVQSLTDDTARLAVRCSKGTYIRSLVTDIGEALGCGAHVTQLRRTSVSPFENETLYDLDTLQALLNESKARLDDALLPLDAGLAHLASVRLSNDQLVAFRQGQAANCEQVSAAGCTKEPMCKVYTLDKRFVGMGLLSDCGTSVSPRRVLQFE